MKLSVEQIPYGNEEEEKQIMRSMESRKYIMEKTEIKTKRMTLFPMSDVEIRELMACTASDELRTAYGEMLDGCKRD